MLATLLSAAEGPAERSGGPLLSAAEDPAERSGRLSVYFPTHVGVAELVDALG